MQCLEEGTQKLEEGDVQAAKVRSVPHFYACACLDMMQMARGSYFVKTLYQRSVDIKRTASGLFNLGVTHYHLSESFRIDSFNCVLSVTPNGFLMAVGFQRSMTRPSRAGRIQ